MIPSRSCGPRPHADGLPPSYDSNPPMIIYTTIVAFCQRITGRCPCRRAGDIAVLEDEGAGAALLHYLEQTFGHEDVAMLVTAEPLDLLTKVRIRQLADEFGVGLFGLQCPVQERLELAGELNLLKHRRGPL